MLRRRPVNFKLSTLNLSGFTLIELVVVIAVIAILAGFLMPALRTARRKAMEAKTQSMISSLQIALSMYETDFGDYPDISNAAVDNTTNNQDMVDRLADDIAHGSNSNWNGPYIDLNEDDLTAPVTNNGQLKDPWGVNYYYGTDEIGPPLLVGAPSGRGYYIYSSGPDKTNDNGGNDDINNW